jgi:putative oxidoreductase
MTPDPNRAAHALAALRLVVAGLILAHGVARWLAGGVQPFGGFLSAEGLPAGLVLAWGISLYEVLATPLLAAGRLVTPIALGFAAIYAVGIALVHAPAGWFVVGLGRNGAEYSVLLIALLLALAYSHVRKTP